MARTAKMPVPDLTSIFAARLAALRTPMKRETG